MNLHAQDLVWCAQKCQEASQRFHKAWGALESIREPQERVSEVVWGLWDITGMGNWWRTLTDTMYTVWYRRGSGSPLLHSLSGFFLWSRHASKWDGSETAHISSISPYIYLFWSKISSMGLIQEPLKQLIFMFRVMSRTQNATASLKQGLERCGHSTSWTVVVMSHNPHD